MSEFEKNLIAKPEMVLPLTKKLSSADLKAMGLVVRKASRPKLKPLVGRWQVWYQVEDVASLTLAQADALLGGCRVDGKFHPGGDDRHMDTWWHYEPRTLWVDITYPVARGVRLTVSPYVRTWPACKACGDRRPIKEEPRMSPGYLLWTVAKEYERLYKEHEKYGVWGHALSDLGFESIQVEKDGVVRLGIGS